MARCQARTPDRERVVRPLRRLCPACGGAMRIRYENRRTLVTLSGTVRMHRKIRRCETPFSLIRAFHDLELDAPQDLLERALELRTLIAGIGIELHQERIQTEQRREQPDAPSRSWTSPACTIACIRRPSVSTSMW